MVSSDSEFRIRSAKGLKERIIIPTLLAASGALGGAAGMISKNRRTLGFANVSAAYAANLAIVAVCYCGARELARDARLSEADDLINSAVGGFASGALLGRLQGGRIGAIRYSIIFAAAGTAFDFTELHLRPIIHRFMNTVFEGSCDKKDRFSRWWKMPEWSPIQVLDKEALAAKQANEEKMDAQGVFGNQNKE